MTEVTIQTYHDVYDPKFIERVIELFPETKSWFDTQISLDNLAIKVEELIKLMHVTLAYNADMMSDFAVYNEKTRTLTLNNNVPKHRQRFEIARQIGFLILDEHHAQNDQN